MKIAGVVAEYNPFHAGHAWHLAETRRATGCDYIIVCMDGHFTQRGEPALFSKWNRARMALACGADAVFELPAVFAVRSADAFARGGVALLGGLGADALSFGCETDDPALLRTLADMREREPEAVSARVREYLRQGMTHSRARGRAVAEALQISEALLRQPNLILGSEYVRAVDALGFPMTPVAVPRRGDYHGAELGLFASASAIRAAIGRGETDAALQCLPPAARPFAAPDRLHPMDDLLMDRLRRMTPADMARLPDVSEGLQHRLRRLCRETAGRDDLLEALKCRRYTQARLSRLLAHALLEWTADALAACPAPRCARLIGLRAGAEPLLRELKERSALPIVSNPGALRGEPVFEMECRATDLWALLHDDPALRVAGREFTEKFVKL